MSGPPIQNDFRNFCMSDNTEKVYQKLEEVISVCKELKNYNNTQDKICLLN